MENRDSFQDQDSDVDQVELVVDEESRSEFRRLDHFLGKRLPHLSRSFIKRLFELGECEAEVPQPLSLSKMPPLGTKIILHLPPPLPSELIAENIPLEILFEDEHLLFVNKPVGLVTHPGAGNHSGTMVNALLYHCPDLKGIGGVKRPGIVHRLDKGTSGVMVVAKSQKCHEELVTLFSAHQLTRRYEAILSGVPSLKSGTLQTQMGRHPSERTKMCILEHGGKKAITHFKVLAPLGIHFTHAEFILETGRTHQIRVHAAGKLKTPLLMDPAYGHPKTDLKKMQGDLLPLLQDYAYPFLHAKHLSLIHPMTKQLLSFTIPPSSLFQEVLLKMAVKRG